MLFVAFLALCHTVLANAPNVDRPAAGHTPTVSTITHANTVYVLTSHPTASLSDELAIEKRHIPIPGVIDQIEATIVVETVPDALSTVLSSQGTPTEITVPSEASNTATPGTGIYGGGGNSGSGIPNGPGSGVGSGPGSGTGNGSGPGNSPTGGSGPGLPGLPSGAYGQSPNTAGQESPSSAGGPFSSPSSQQSSGPEGQQSPSPTGGESQSPGTAQQSANATEQQSSSPAITSPGVLVTIVPVLGTTVETITISLASAPGNSALSTSSVPGTSVWGPFSTPSAQPLPTTFVTIQVSNTLSTPCESATAPYGVLSAPYTSLPTSLVTVSGAGVSSSIPTVSSTPSVVVVTISGSQGSAQAGNPTSFNVPGWSATPNVPAWATASGTIVTTQNSLQTSLDATGPGTASPQLSSTCTTDIFTNVISTSNTPSTITAAATMAAGSSTSSQRTTRSSTTHGTAKPTVTPVPDVNGGVTAAQLNLSVIYGTITLALLASITRMI